MRSFICEIIGMENMQKNPMPVSMNARNKNGSFLESINFEKRNPPSIRPNRNVVSMMAKEWMLLSTKYFKILNHSTSYDMVQKPASPAMSSRSIMVFLE